jgi:hypothetical protein
MSVLKYLALDLIAATDARQRGDDSRLTRPRRFSRGRSRGLTTVATPVVAMSRVTQQPPVVAAEVSGS